MLEDRSETTHETSYLRARKTERKMSSAIADSQKRLLEEISKRDKELIPLDGSPLDEAEKDRRTLLQLIEGDHFKFPRALSCRQCAASARRFQDL